MSRVFVSHASADMQVAGETKAWLVANGFESVFLDFDRDDGISPGSNWERELYRRIDGCQAVVLLLTSAWHASKWCFVEFAQARALGKAIIPLIVTPGDERLVSPDIQHLYLYRDRELCLGQLAALLKRLALDAQAGFAWDARRPPFPGLLAFEREDAAIFFGRDDDTRLVIERLNALRIQDHVKTLALLGASGSGKSSILRAGVLPRLEFDRRNWIELPPFRPQNRPLAALGQAVQSALGIDGASEDWQQKLSAPDLSPAVAELAAKLRARAGQSDAHILVSIDQGEELFSLASQDECAAFFRVLNALTQAGAPFVVLLTLRSDYLGELQHKSGDLLFQELSLRPLKRDRIRKVIEGPARIAGLAVEEELISRAMLDVASEDALPLLAFALRELYDRYAPARGTDSATAVFSLAHYEALGDPSERLNPLENAVRGRANLTLDALRLSDAELQALREAFVGFLVRLGDGDLLVRRPAAWDALPAQSHRALQALAASRLLVIREENGVRLVEVTHEALLRTWPKLRRWLEEEREFIAGKGQLERLYREWSSAAPAVKRSALLYGLQLQRARKFLTLHPKAFSSAEREFVEASGRRSLFTRVAVGSLAVLLLGIGLTYAGSIGYARYVAWNTSECDLLAAEQDNNIGIEGVEFDRIDADRAVPACERATAGDPDHPRLLHNLGRALEKAGRYPEAASAYQRAANLNFAWSQNNLAILYLSNPKGIEPDLGRAGDLLRRATEQGNAQAEANYTGMDFLEIVLGHNDARAILDKALRAKGEDGGTAAIETRLEAFKRKASIDDKGLSLRVLDRLGVTSEISKALRNKK